MIQYTPRLALFRHLCLFVVTASVALLFSGCASDPDEPDYQPLIFYEALRSTPSSMKADISLPVSGLTYAIIKTPQIPDQNFISTAVYEVGPPEARMPALLVRLDEPAARKLYHHTMAAKGTRLFLTVNGRPVGVHYIAEPIPTGDLFFFVELPHQDTEELKDKLLKLSQDLNESILVIRKKRAEND